MFLLTPCGLIAFQKMASSESLGFEAAEKQVSCILRFLTAAGGLGRRRIMLTRTILVMFCYSGNIVLVRGLFLKTFPEL